MRFVIRYGYGTMYMISKRNHKRFLHFVRFTHFGLREGEMTHGGASPHWILRLRTS